jgi:plasmid stabilization system protein ParE
MRVVWTKGARKDLDEILDYTATHFPTAVVPLEARLRAVVARLAEHPFSARAVGNRPGVRVVPLIRYPFKVFYRVRTNELRILHIHHAARRPWAD